MGGGGGKEYERVFLLIDPYLWKNFEFLSEFRIEVSSSKFSDT